MKQGQLLLEIISKGSFEKSEPTIYHGQDLDVPTYIRRNLPLKLISSPRSGNARAISKRWITRRI